MKLWARVTIQTQDKVCNLIRAFFSEFNPNSTIFFKDYSANLEIVFDQEPPKKIIEAILDSDIAEFSYIGTETVTDFVEFDSEVANTKSEKLESEAAPAESDEVKETESEAEDAMETEPEATSAETDEPEEKLGSTNKSKRKTVKRAKHYREMPELHVPLIDELAKKSESFSDFANNISNWLELGKRAEFFNTLIEALKNEVSEPSTLGINYVKVITKELGYKDYDRIFVGQKIASKLKEESINGTMLPFLRAVISYQITESTKTEQNAEESQVELLSDKLVSQTIEDANSNGIDNSADGNVEEESCVFEEKEEVANEETSSEGECTGIKCLPKIPDFEDGLSMIDYSSQNEYVSYDILYLMGIEKINSSFIRNSIKNLSISAVKAEKFPKSIESLFELAGINYFSKDGMNIRIAFADFINTFAKKYVPTWQTINVYSFLKDLSAFVRSNQESK